MPLLHELRANRNDLTNLPDDDGHMWCELVAATQDPELSKTLANSKIMKEWITESYNPRLQFPYTRLGTLWNNKAWHPVITEWCQCPIGQPTFAISTFADAMVWTQTDDVSDALQQETNKTSAYTCSFGLPK